jgi:hypothetical protein
MLGFNSPSGKLSERRRKRLVLQLTTKIINTNSEMLYNINCEVKVLCELNIYLGISIQCFTSVRSSLIRARAV